MEAVTGFQEVFQMYCPVENRTELIVILRNL